MTIHVPILLTQQLRLTEVQAQDRATQTTDSTSLFGQLQLAGSTSRSGHHGFGVPACTPALPPCTSPSGQRPGSVAWLPIPAGVSPAQPRRSAVPQPSIPAGSLPQTGTGHGAPFRHCRPSSSGSLAVYSVGRCLHHAKQVHG